MVEFVYSILCEVEMVFFMVFVDEKWGKGDDMIIECFKVVKIFVILVINKIDKVYLD